MVKGADLITKFVMQVVEQLLESLADGLRACFVHGLPLYLLRHSIFEVAPQQ